MKKISFLFSLLFLLGIGTLSAQLWSQLGMDIDGEAAADFSGASVSISKTGTRLAIGAYQNGGNGTFSGHVRVYSESGGAWSQLGIDIDGEAAQDVSGSAVVMSGDGLRVVIGAQLNDGSSSSGIFNCGHVRVYKESGGAWVKVGSDIDGEAEGDRSGWSVSTSFDGKRVAIGAIDNDGNGSGAGHVRVYKQTGNNWTLVGNDIDGEAAGDGSGSAVSMSNDGNVVAIGAGGNDGNGTDAGHVRVYRLINGNWVQEGQDIDGEAAGDGSGGTRSVSLNDDGTIVAIGAYRNDGNGIDAGHVRVFRLINGTWVQEGQDIDGEGPSDESGYSVSLSSNGGMLAIGARLNDGAGTDAGHVRVYRLINGTWVQEGQDIDGEAPGDESGRWISISDNAARVAIGAWHNDGNGTNAGHVRVYDQVPCDADGDGYDNVACGGSDCDDNDAGVNPGATEVCNGVDDNCNNTVDEGSTDTDGDGVCDGLDNCQAIANADQADADGDGMGDVCDACPNDPENDADSDGICGDVDNCPSNANSTQADSDCDMVGDACDVCPNGDDSVDNNNDGIPDCSQLLNYALYSSAWKCGTNKIYVCHSGTTTCISKNQLSTHYNHGDDVGPCVSCPIPIMIMPGSIDKDIRADGVELTILQGEDSSTAENHVTQSKQLTVYPNPVREILNISFEGEIQSIRVMSSNGTAVRIDDLISGNHQLDISKLSPGIYFLAILADDKWYQSRFIKM